MLEVVFSGLALVCVVFAIFQKLALIKKNKELSLKNDKLVASIDIIVSSAEKENDTLINHLQGVAYDLESKVVDLKTVINSDRELIIDLEDKLSEKESKKAKKQLSDELEKKLTIVEKPEKKKSIKAKPIKKKKLVKKKGK